MASYKEDWSKLDWAFPFQRTGKFPLDRTAMFSSYDDAVLYASGEGKDSRKLGGTSYIGQVLTVYENDTVGVYVINQSRGLTKLASGASTTEELISALTVKVETNDNPDANTFKSYTIKQGTGTLGTINIPKDFLVKSAEIKTCTVLDQPQQDFKVGDKYLDFVINTKDSTDETNAQHIYINLKDLTDVYTGLTSDTIATVVTAENKISAELKDDAVTTAKIKDGAVTTAKLATDAVTTIKIKDGNVTLAKLASDVTEKFAQKQHDHVLSDITDFSEYTTTDVTKENKIITKTEINALTANHQITADNTFIKGIKQENGVITGITTGTIDIPKVELPTVKTISTEGQVITSVWQTEGAISAETTQLSTSHISGFSADVNTLIGTKVATLTANHQITATNTFIKGIKQENGVITSVLTGNIVLPTVNDVSTAHGVVVAVKQTNGTIAVSRRQLSVTDIAGMNAYQLSGNYLSTAAAFTAVDYNNDETKLVNKKYVDETFEKIDNVMHFKGVVTADPLTATTLTGYANGDVVIYGALEYVYVASTNKWEKFGDQSIDHSKYALKSEVSNHISAVEIVDNTGAVVETLSSTTHKIKLGTMAKAKAEDYYTNEEADARFVQVQDLIIDCGGASDGNLTETDEQYFKVDGTGVLTSFTGTLDTVGSTIVVPETVDDITVTSIGTVFTNKTWIKAVYIPEGIKVPAGAFDGCTGLPKDDSGVIYTN